MTPVAAQPQRARGVHVRYRPLGSPSGHRKRSYVYVPVATVACGPVANSGCGRWGAYRGWCGEGYTGRVLYRVPTQPGYIGIARAQPLVLQERPAPHARHSSPCGASAHLAGPPRADPHLQPIWARFHQIYTKVSPYPGVSTKCAHEACHTPCFKKPLGNHDLEFPDIPIWLAFSHKE